MKRSSSGFTLVELLVALFVFSLLSAFSYMAINQLLYAEDYVQAENDELKNIQKTLFFIERDLRQSIVYTPSNAGGSSQNVRRFHVPDRQLFTGDIEQQGELLVEFFVLQSVSDQLIKRSYWFKDDTLSQQSDIIGNPTTNSFSTSSQIMLPVVLANKLSRVSFDILETNSGSSQNTQPLSVELLLEHKDFGQIKRIIFLSLPEAAIPAILNIASLAGALKGVGSGSGTQVGGNVSNNNGNESDRGDDEDETRQPSRPVCLDPFAGNEEC